MVKKLIQIKSGIKTNVDKYYHKYMKIKINSDDVIPLAKSLNMHDVIIIIKSAFDENCNNQFYQLLLQKCSFN